MLCPCSGYLWIGGEVLDDEKGFVEGFEEIGKDDFGKRIVGQRRKLKVEFIPGVSFCRTQKVQKCTFCIFRHIEGSDEGDRKG